MTPPESNEGMQLFLTNLVKNQNKIETQYREDIRGLSQDIKSLSEKQSHDTERIFQRLDDIVGRQNDFAIKQTELQAEIERRFTSVNHDQDLTIKELCVKAEASGEAAGMVSGKKSGTEAGIKAGAGAGAGVATAIGIIIMYVADFLNSFKT